MKGIEYIVVLVECYGGFLYHFDYIEESFVLEGIWIINRILGCLNCASIWFLYTYINH